MRLGKIEGKTRARICARRAHDGDGRERLVRDWRHCGWAPATGARSDDGRDHGRHDDCREADAADSQGPHSECNVLRTADWLDWIDGEAGARRGIFRESREISV